VAGGRHLYLRFRRINAADQTAHAGAGDVVHGDVISLQPGNNVDVGEPEGPTTLQYQTDLGALLPSPSRWSVLARATGSGNASQDECKEASKWICHCRHKPLLRLM